MPPPGWRDCRRPAAEELRRAAALGLPDAQLRPNADGRPLGGHECRALFAAAAEPGTALVVHPTLRIDRAAVDAHGLLTATGLPRAPAVQPLGAGGHRHGAQS